MISPQQIMISVVVVDWRCCCYFAVAVEGCFSAYVVGSPSMEPYTVNNTFSVKLNYYILVHIGPNFMPYAEQQPYNYLIV
jgi:hypothetical protein